MCAECSNYTKKNEKTDFVLSFLKNRKLLDYDIRYSTTCFQALS